MTEITTDNPIPKALELAADFTCLVDEREQAPARLHPIYDAALENAKRAVQAAFDSEAVQAEIAAQRTSINSDVELIEKLKQQGHIDETQAVSHLERILYHEDYSLMRAAARAGAMGLSATTGAIDAIHPDLNDPGEPTPENDPKGGKVKILITHDAIVVNNVRFPDSMHHATRDRKIAFLHAAQELEPGEAISPVELYHKAMPGSEFDRGLASPIHAWFKQYVVDPKSSEPLLIHNGKRGNSSRYTRNPELDLVLIDETTITQEELLAAPSKEEQQFMKLIILQLVDDLSEELDTSALEHIGDIKLSELGESQIARLKSLSLYKIQQLCKSEATGDTIYADAKANDKKAIIFLDAIIPFLQKVEPIIIDDAALESIALEVIEAK